MINLKGEFLQLLQLTFYNFQLHSFSVFQDHSINLGVPSNLKLRSECNFRRLWGGGGGKGLKPKLLLGFTK